MTRIGPRATRRTVQTPAIPPKAKYTTEDVTNIFWRRGQDPGVTFTGSRSIPGITIREDADWDFVVYVENLVDTHSYLIRECGFKMIGLEDLQASGADETDLFVSRSYKKDDLNLIVTCNEEFYRRWIIATGAAQLLQLQNRPDQIDLFTKILHLGVTYERENFTLEPYHPRLNKPAKTPNAASTKGKSL